jgi:protoporphyrinogen oxidase
MSNSIEFLLFPPLGIIDKSRLAATILRAKRTQDWRSLEGIPVEDWLRRHSGSKTFEKIWLPLLRAKLGDAYRRTSAAFIWATIQRMYAARRSGMKREMFGYLPGGYARIIDSFTEAVQKAGVRVLLGMDVCSVASEPTREVRVEMKGGTRIRFDRVVLTTPTTVAARLCPGLSQQEQARLEGIEYQGVVCASVLTKKPLAGYYITNITDDWVPFTAVIEMSALVHRDEFNGNSLVYLPRYAACDDPAFEIPDHEWGERAMETLSGMYPDFDPSDVLAFRVSRERFVYALPTVDYSQRVPPRNISIPGVYIVNSSQILNGTLNVNETVRLAEDALGDLDDETAGPFPWSGPPRETA